MVKFNSYRKNDYVIRNKPSGRMSVHQREPTDGGILHRVAELLEEEGKENQVKRQRRGSLVMGKGKKLFNF